jgi:hypothetical protein
MSDDYGVESMADVEAEISRRTTFWRRVVVHGGIFIFVWGAMFLFTWILSGCSLTINAQSDKQPWQIIYSGDGKTE